MRISVIIPVYNEAEHIGQCLASIFAQTYTDIEVLVVDDGSTDATIQEVKKFPRVILIEQNHEGSGAARNKAAAMATGELLAMIDGDMYLEKDVFDQLAKPIIEGKYIGTTWEDERVANPDNIWSQCWSIANNLPYDKRYVNLPEFSTTYRLIKKDVFLKAGGNRAERANCEDQIADKVGELAWTVPGAVVYHYNPSTFDDVYKSAKWFGKGRIHVYTGPWKMIVFLLKYSIFKSLVAGVIKSIQRKNWFFLWFKIVFDFAVTHGYIYALITKDNKK
jgi:glycosyltransferase involved in cell wall biosynthesis